MRMQTKLVKANTTVHRPKLDRNKITFIPVKKNKTPKVK